MSATEFDSVVLKTKLVISELEVSHLKRELAVLGARLAMQQKTFKPINEARDFADLAMVLVEVLRRSQMSFRIDQPDRAIIDLAARPSERLVAGPQRVAKFITWLEENQAIPPVKELLNPG